MMRLSAALADEVYAPARAADALHGQRRRRHTADGPAGKSGRGLKKRVGIGLAPLAQHQRKGPAFLGGKLQATGSSHGHLPDLPDDGSQPTVAQAFLHDGKDIFVAAAFGLDQPGGRKASLGQAGCEQVSPA